VDGMISRRNFLKIAASVPLITVPNIFLMSQEAKVPKGFIREIIAYDISTDSILAQYDVLASKTNMQFVFNTYITSTKDKEELSKSRNLAREMLNKKLSENNIKWNELTVLPLPHHLQAKYI
jgi:hypothetical protein